MYADISDFRNVVKYANKVLESILNNSSYIEVVIEVKRMKARALRELGDYNEAISLLTNIINENSSISNPLLYATRGLTYFKMKEYKLATNDFIRCTTLDDNDAEAFYYLGICYKFLGQKGKSCENLLKSSKLGYKDALEEYPKICN